MGRKSEVAPTSDFLFLLEADRGFSRPLMLGPPSLGACSGGVMASEHLPKVCWIESLDPSVTMWEVMEPLTAKRNGNHFLPELPSLGHFVLSK